MSSAIAKRIETNGEDRILAVMEGIQDKYTHDTAVIIRTVKANGIELFSPGGLAELRTHLVNDDHEDERTGRRFRYAPRSANRILAAAKARMRQVMDSDVGVTIGQAYQVEKVIKAVKGVKMTSGLDNRKLLTPDEVLALVEGCDPGLRLIVRFLASTGCRISEALAIHLSDISRTREICDIQVIGKGSKARTVNCKRELVEEIVKHFHGMSYLFEHNGKAFNRIYISQRIGVVAQRTIGRDHISAHCLRHAYATSYLEAHPEKLQKVSQYLGHSQVSTTTSFYIHTRMTPEEAVAVAY
jgi:integrase